MLSVPVSSVRTDKPTPYVKAVENGRIVHKPVELGARGSAGNEEVVGVKGIPEGTLVTRANLGYLREGTRVRFTQIGGVPVDAPVSAQQSSSAKAP